MKQISKGMILRASILISLVVLMGMSEFENGLKKIGQKFNYFDDEVKKTAEHAGQQIAHFGQGIKHKLETDLDELEHKLSTGASIVVNDLEIEINKIWKTFGIPLLKSYVTIDDPHKNDKAAISSPNILSSEEKEFVNNRSLEVQKAISLLTGETVSIENIPQIACAFSGGGDRAMVLTAGFMQGLSDLKILDSLTYISALSGSTWYIGPWVLNQKPSANQTITIDTYNNMLRNKIKNNTFDIVSTTNQRSINIKQVASESIFPSVVFNQIISSVHFYGALLAHAFLSDFGAKEQAQRLSSQLESTKNGNVPWPIYTSISMAKDDEGTYRYQWYEFNPAQVRNLELNFSLPSYGFGRIFENGQSTGFAPEQSFGFLMGIFGSAFEVNLKDVQRIFSVDEATTLAQDEKIVASLEAENKIAFFKDLIAKPNDFEALKLVIAKKILDGLSNSRIGSDRVAPAQINNPFKKYQKAPSWLQNRERLTFVDAGIDYNLPLRPLFIPERNVKLIIVGDASSNAGSYEELYKALSDIERFYKINYKKDEQMSDNTMLVFRSQQNHAPVIVYFQFFLDQGMVKKSMADSSLRNLIEREKLNSFDAQKCLDKSYCGTLNFAYNLEQFNQLAGVGEFVVKAHKNKLLQIIKETLKK